ncbi:hypothetical protein CYK19_06565 [Streptococcus mitis]|uniref:Uncharacterized protein n=2 Tax=Streptococcus TaxID=1301 RepID=A0A2I1TY46_STRMT|nr:hypothetical protein CYK19_06565 [Streptococcus mitis]PMB85772.1 hypothetical protein CK799_06135 [Streptococcus oralis subsp. dentisani]TKD49322.1 hypothetical protein FBF73_06830 [Streptococcus mitis]
MIPLQREIFDKTRFARTSFIKYIVLANWITIEIFNQQVNWLLDFRRSYEIIRRAHPQGWAYLG